MSQLLENLNPAQQEICKWINGPVLILAGAGSGKTRVLTHRIAHLILDHQIYPKSILAVTFTNKAAKEMKKRVESILNQSIDGLWIGTFHSLFARILRIEAKNIGYDSSFTIYDSQDSVNVVKGILTDHEINLKEHYPKQVYYHLSSLKDQLIEPSPIKYSVHLTKDELYDYVYYKYEEVLAKNNAFDFNDLIIKPIQLFQ
ncbi:MAG: UvrD-helicase domain-containing protein, partial [Calditrichaeota bacterium]|nr:UvrD-helicase domain-containing protein [Calditrichota bacterium]